MAKSIKFKNNNYLDTRGIVHNKKILSEILNSISNKLNNKIVDYTFDSSNLNEISFQVNLKPNERYKIRIEGATEEATDIFLQINDISTGYYQLGQYLNGNLSTDGSLNNVTGYRSNKQAFYYAQSLRKDISMIEGDLFLQYSPLSKKYYPVYNWESSSALQTQQMLSRSHGFLVSTMESITKLRFATQGAKFLSGTRIQIVKDINFS